jgi:hypothetical protein
MQHLPAWINRARIVAAWATIFCFVSLFIAHNTLNSYCCPPWPLNAPRPPEWIFTWRNGSVIAVFITGFISFPRWQSLVGLGVTALYLYMIVTTW